VTFLVERLAELRRHLDHLRAIRPRVSGWQLAARRGDRFEDYTEAVRLLARDARFPADLVEQLEPLPGFRNVVVHEYVALDLRRVVEALDRLEPVERFAEVVRSIEA